MTQDDHSNLDYETTLAAECLLAMSTPIVHASRQQNTVRPQRLNLPTCDEQHNSLFMVARILADLGKIQQAPIEQHNGTFKGHDGGFYQSLDSLESSGGSECHIAP